MSGSPSHNDDRLGVDAPAGGLAQLHDDMQADYYKLLELVGAFDQRLLTIKGWGVTVSLASIGLAFQQSHYGLFLVAAISGVAFWGVEAVTKTHQMRFYPRMRAIEVISCQRFGVSSNDGVASSPLIDWSWKLGPQDYHQPREFDPDRPERERPTLRTRPSGVRRLARTICFLHVALPHVISVLAGVILFALGASGGLHHMPL